MREYRPTYPTGWTPRHLRGEYTVPMDTPRHQVEVPRIIPPEVQCQRVPPGAALRESTDGLAHRWNNQTGEALAASLESAATQSRRSKAAAKVLQAPNAVKPQKEDLHAKRRAQILAWLHRHGPATRAEIAAGIDLPLEATRVPTNYLMAHGLIKARHYALAGRPGHQAQYIPTDTAWPSLSADATPITKPRTSRRRPTE